ncbi:MAG TPA: RHS repeat-associated core domain-containing protein, partial [Pirellulaceae bacterium]|nr:RHS repeat-associated core domain-containing protein [Pirellulaceae bacterium]
MQDKAYAYAQAIEEYQSEGAGPKRLAVTTTFADDLVSQTRYDDTGTPTTRYVQADGFGSTRLLTDENGNVTDAIDYDAFGNVIARSGSTDIEHLYRGEALDPNTGFYYLRARWMNPTSGRFLTQDSFPGFGNSPFSLNKYLYTHANPVVGTDPSGFFLEQEGIRARVEAELARISLSSTVRLVGTHGTRSFVKRQLFKQLVKGAVASIGAAILIKTIVEECLKGDVICDLDVPVLSHGSELPEHSRHVRDSQLGNGSNLRPTDQMLNARIAVRDPDWRNP